MKGPGNTPGDEQARVAPTAWALAVLLMIGLLMAYLRSLPQNAGQAGTTPLALGFLLLSAWCAGLLVEKLRLPKLTGYILAGLAAGPALTGLISAEKLVALQPINDLALTFIALVAGGELHFPMVRRLWRSIAGWIGGQLLLTPPGGRRGPVSDRPLAPRRDGGAGAGGAGDRAVRHQPGPLTGGHGGGDQRGRGQGTLHRNRDGHHHHPRHPGGADLRRGRRRGRKADHPGRGFRSFRTHQPERRPVAFHSPRRRGGVRGFCW
ncbi:MAG: cation:proton antiporter [Acidobacteriota bacterium]|nr:cation:proton antiporter [Acidobacteriota bacterium]